MLPAEVLLLLRVYYVQNTWVVVGGLPFCGLWWWCGGWWLPRGHAVQHLGAKLGALL